eukprot:scaffold176531_cov45-Prasinocladus_malaysianus.AAC.1
MRKGSATSTNILPALEDSKAFAHHKGSLREVVCQGGGKAEPPHPQAIISGPLTFPLALKAVPEEGAE